MERRCSTFLNLQPAICDTKATSTTRYSLSYCAIYHAPFTYRKRRLYWMAYSRQAYSITCVFEEIIRNAWDNSRAVFTENRY